MKANFMQNTRNMQFLVQKTMFDPNYHDKE